MGSKSTKTKMRLSRFRIQWAAVVQVGCLALAALALPLGGRRVDAQAPPTPAPAIVINGQLVIQNANLPPSADAGIYTMNADGTQPRKLTGVQEAQWRGWPQWSHDGKWIAFEAWPNGVKGADTKVFVVSADGGEPKELGIGKSPSWSADDKQIVFAVPRGSSETKNGTWIMNADGTGRQWLFAGGRPACSPDGSRIAFVDAVEGNDKLFVYDLLTAETQKVLDDYLHVFGCAWSPDSKQICFVGNRRNNPVELAIIDAAGSDKFYKVRLTDNIGRDPSWAPGSKILLWIVVDGMPRLHAIDPASDEMPTLLGSQPAPQQNIDASWSPDGKRIVFSYNPNPGS
jgi:Tol biopolymer transport system component